MFVKYKEKKSQMLCNINPTICQWIFDKFFIDEEVTWGNMDVVLTKDAENIIDVSCKKLGSKGQLFLESRRECWNFSDIEGVGQNNRNALLNGSFIMFNRNH